MFGNFIRRLLPSSKKQVTDRFNKLDKKISELETMVHCIYDQVVPIKKKCPICKTEIDSFLPFGVVKNHLRPNALCPVCKSLERHRLLWRFWELKLNDMLKDKKDGERIKLLHFAPESALLKHFGNNENIDYYPVDFNPNFPGIIKVVDIIDILQFMIWKRRLKMKDTTRPN